MESETNSGGQIRQSGEQQDQGRSKETRPKDEQDRPPVTVWAEAPDGLFPHVGLS